MNPIILLEIAKQIEAFSHECEEASFTDASEAWHLLESCYKEITGRDEIPSLKSNDADEAEPFDAFEDVGGGDGPIICE